MQTRYDRQIIISEIGEKGQEKLRKSEVLLIGFGGLGTPCATYLAQAGIGRLEIIDADTVAFSNLNRQFFFTEQDMFAGGFCALMKRMRKIVSKVLILS